MTTRERDLRTRDAPAIALPSAVPGPEGFRPSSEVRIESTLSRPCRGRNAAPVAPSKATAPTGLEQYSAAKATRAAISSAFSLRVTEPGPESIESERSTTRKTVRSRSSRYSFTNGFPERAVTFRSIERTSAPRSYSRTPSKSMPCPRKRERNEPDCMPSETVRAASLRARAREAM